MKYAYVTALVDFGIAETLRKPIEIKTNLYITNNSEHLARFIESSYLISIGALEARPLTNGTAALYRIDNVIGLEDAHTEVVNFLRETQAFLTSTWLKEDNSANCELAFAFGQDNDHVHSNALALNYSHHTGERKRLDVDLMTLDEICNIHREFFQGIRSQDHPEHTAFRKTISRIDRAMRFMQQARSSEDLGQKIANYCSFFEALLSTSSAELSHQLSERAAFFLSDSPLERLRLFRDVKKAYGIRSKIVHGDVLSPGAISGLVEISKVCDDVARALTLKIIGSQKVVDLLNDGSNEAIDTHMLELIFGIQKSSDETEAKTDA